MKSRWIAIISQVESNLFSLHEDGSISNQVSFIATFNPDVINLKDVNDNYAELSLEILGRKAVYEVDFNKNSAQLIDDIKTDEVK